jgi:uncharacterized membrane-anchored protein
MVFKKELIKEVMTLSIIVAVLHQLALTLFLYWRTDWFDIMMHFLGGLLIGLIAGFIFYTSGYLNFPKGHKLTIFSMVMGSVLVVGLAWELWEIFMGFTNVLSDRVDTVIDIVMDLIGGVVAYYYMIGKIWQK